MANSNPNEAAESQPEEQTAHPNPAEQTTDQATMGQTTDKVDSGQSVTDIFSRPDTKSVMAQIIALFASLAAGYGVFTYIAISSITGDGAEEVFAELGGIVIALFTTLIVIIMMPIMGVIAGIRVNAVLADVRDDLVYGTSFVSSAAGTLAVVTTTIVTASFALSSEVEFSLGDFGSIIILSAFSTGLVAAAVVYCLRQFGP